MFYDSQSWREPAEQMHVLRGSIRGCHSHLVLCSVCPPLEKLLKITGLNKLLTVKKTQKEALKVWD